MFRIIQSHNNILPWSYPVDSAASFESGMIGQLKLNGNQITVGVSDGTAPLGIIDDMKQTAFSSNSIDEVIIASPPSTTVSGVLVSSIDYSANLENPNITASSFMSNPVDVVLIPRNGVVTFVAGTPLNFDLDGDGVADSIRTVVSYSYQVPNIPGQDTTFASGRVTVWRGTMEVQTDQFETNQRYPLNAPVFVNDSGKMTTRQIAPEYPPIGFVSSPPSSIWGALGVIWF